MQHTRPLLTNPCGPPTHRIAIRPLGARDGALLSLVLWACVHTGEAWAGDGVPAVTGLGKPGFDLPGVPDRLSTWSLPLQPFDSRLPVGDEKSFSTEFRPRGPSILATAPKEPLGDGIQHGSVWQRLGEFRTHNRLRLLTLWQTGGSSLSLQAGRKGDPTLQWTSRLSHRGTDSGCLFDELFSTSAGGAIGKGLHLLPHFTAIDSQSKPAKSSETPLAATAAGN